MGLGKDFNSWYNQKLEDLKGNYKYEEMKVLRKFPSLISEIFCDAYNIGKYGLKTFDKKRKR